MLNSGLTSQFAYDYVDDHRTELQLFKSAKDFTNKFEVSEAVFSNFLKKADGLKIIRTPAEVKDASPYLKNQIKAYIGRQLFKSEAFFPVLLREDKAFNRAMEILNKPKGI